MDVSPHQLIDILLSVNHPVLIFKSRRAWSHAPASRRAGSAAPGGSARCSPARGTPRPSLTVTNTQNICCVDPFDLLTHGTSLCVDSQSNEPQRQLMDKQNFNRLTTSKFVFYFMVGFAELHANFALAWDLSCITSCFLGFSFKAVPT